MEQVWRLIEIERDSAPESKEKLEDNEQKKKLKEIVCINTYKLNETSAKIAR